MAEWKDFVKKANWFTDTFVVSPLTSLYAKQNEAYKEQLAKLNAQAKAVTKPPAPKPSPTPPIGRDDELVRLAQGVSDHYRRGSPGRSKFYYGGKAVAK